eukprot:4162389-Amphidinium_carterae.1
MQPMGGRGCIKDYRKTHATMQSCNLHNKLHDRVPQDTCNHAFGLIRRHPHTMYTAMPKV